LEGWWWQAREEEEDVAAAGRQLEREQRAAQRGAMRRQKARAVAQTRERKRIALERMGIFYSFQGRGSKRLSWSEMAAGRVRR
jgi:hypothetical protein